MKKVFYGGGESRSKAGVAVDYMMVEIDGTELYAESEAVDGDEDANYDDLKAEIIAQANDAGIDENELEF